MSALVVGLTCGAIVAWIESFKRARRSREDEILARERDRRRTERARRLSS